jgi:hypothetical protein
MNCFFCGREIETRERVGFRQTCPGCDRALHACRNCDFYDRTYHNECRETQADRVVDKERANFCEYFTPSRRRTAAAGPATKSAAVGKLEDLFKKRP